MSTLLIAEDFGDSPVHESYKELQRFKNEMAHSERDSYNKRRRLKEFLLGFVALTLLANNFIQCAVLAPVTTNKLTPEATIFYIARDIALLMASPFLGYLVDRVGCEIPTLAGSVIMFLSTAMIACDGRPIMFLFARVFHGLASACVETAALATVANIFSTTIGRTKAFGVALEIAGLGLYTDVSNLIEFLLGHLHRQLFLILAFLPFANGLIVFLLATGLRREESKQFQVTKPSPVSIWKLVTDTYVLVCAGALLISNVPLVFLQRTTDHWGHRSDTTSLESVSTDSTWFLLLSYLLGITFTVLLTTKYSGFRWLLILGGLISEGLCCFTVPFIETYEIMEISVCGVAFAVGTIRAAVLPTLACVMEIRHVPVFGSVYAIANIFLSMGNVISPLVAYLNVVSVGFATLIVAVGFSCVLYAPTLFHLRRV